MRYDPATGLWIDDATGDAYDDNGNLVMTGSGANQSQSPSVPAAIAGPPNANGVIGGMANESAARYPIRSTDLGDRVVTYYSDGTSDVQPKGRIPSEASASSGASIINSKLAAKTAAERLAEEQRQFNEKFGADKAIHNQQQAVSDAGVSGMFNGQPTESARQYNSTQALEYYKQLAANAANPRNFVQSFFQQRGQVAPAAAQGQGNVDAIQRYLPFLLGGAVQGATGASPANPGVATTQIVPDTSPPAFGGGGVPVATQGGGSRLLPQFANPTAIGQRDNQGSPIMQQANGERVSAGPGTTLLSPQQVALSSELQRAGASQSTMQQNVPGAVSRDYVGSSEIQGQMPGYNGEGAPVAKSQEQKYGASFAKGGKIKPPGRVLPEPIVGKGTMTGDTYTFNEPDPRTGKPRPEGVVPAQYLPKFLQQRHGMTTGSPQRTPQDGGGHAYYYGGDIGSDGPPLIPGPDNPYDAPGMSMVGPGAYGPTTVNQPNNNEFMGPINPNPQYDYTPNLGPIGPSNPYSQLQQSSGFANDPGPLGSLQQSSGFASDPGMPTDVPGISQVGPGAVGPGFMGPINPFASGAPRPWFDIPTPAYGVGSQPFLGGVPAYERPDLSGLGQPPLPAPTVAPGAPIGGSPSPVAGGGGIARTLPVLGDFSAQGGTPATSGGALPVRQPISQPQTSNNYNVGSAPFTGGLTPAQASPAGTFGNATGNLPKFLPGEDSSANNVLAALQASNAVPPFLTRIFGQAQGDQSLGTNQPNTTKLPNDVPLVSQLSYNQMTPSEQQALLSYVSSYGVTPDDYLALIRMYSPQGASSSQPLFGNRFNQYRQ